MNAVSVKILKIFFLFAAFIWAVSGCGSSNSTASTPENTGTGALAAKLTWSSSGAKTTAKTLYAAPAGVDPVKILVLNGNLVLVSIDFSAAAGTGTIYGIPAGIGLTVKVQGLVSGSLIYERIISNVTIEVGKVTNLGEITMASVTTAAPASGTYTTPQSVTLTASTTPATIYYTTNGNTPDTSSISGSSPIQDIQISSNASLKFFSINSENVQEDIKTAEYVITP